MVNKTIYRITGSDKIPNNLDINTVQSWTDDVKWPETILQYCNPKEILENAKHPSEIQEVHNTGFTGKNIGIAIIDQRLYLEHPEYKNRIKHYEKVGNWPSTDMPDYHGSLVVGCAAGKTTGTAPDADIYYFAANNWPPIGKFKHAIAKLFGKQTLEQGHRAYTNMAIRRVLETNKTLPENQKIRFLSCSWGSKSDQFREQSDKLFDECEKNGIMVIGGFYKHERNKSRCCNKSGQTILADGQDKTEQYKNLIGIPTDCKTTPYYQGGYIYKKQGGASSTYPYLAGVFACACQDNEIFFTRPNWQEDLWNILQETAIQNNNGPKMINPIGIRERVTQIAREMEINLINNKRLQNE